LSPEGRVGANDGDTVKVSFYPDSGYKISALYKNGVAQSGLTSPFSVTNVIDDYIVVAVFVTS